MNHEIYESDLLVIHTHSGSGAIIILKNTVIMIEQAGC